MAPASCFVLLHDVVASLSGRAARIADRAVGSLHVVQFCRHRHRRFAGGPDGGPPDRPRHDAVNMRKAYVVCGFLGGTTVLLGAYAPHLQQALFLNAMALSLMGLVTANNLA